MATDITKIPLGALILDFAQALQAVAKVKRFGLKKHPANSWKQESVEADTDAMLRHFVAESYEAIDPESDLLHAAHLAWRALARLQKLLQQSVSLGMSKPNAQSAGKK